MRLSLVEIKPLGCFSHWSKAWEESREDARARGIAGPHANATIAGCTAVACNRA